MYTQIYCTETFFIFKFFHSKWLLSSLGAKEWGVGGRNFGVPDGSAPTIQTKKVCKQQLCTHKTTVRRP